MRNEHPERAERGAVAVLVSATMVLLLGVAAMAVDLGAGFNERRQDQTASDLAAVAGGMSYGFAQTNEAIVTNALETARANLTTQFSGANDPAWVAAWRNCTDGDALENPVREPAAWNGIGTPNPGFQLECISVSNNRLRVKVPVQETDTAFGTLLGVDVLSTDAETTVSYASGKSGLYPFAIPGDMAAGEICLDTGASPEAPCDKNDRGSFGAVLPPQWGNDSLGTSQYCPSNGNGDAALAAAIANGVDHLILNYLPANWSANFGNPDANDSVSKVLSSNVNMDLCTTTGGERAVPKDLSHSPDTLPINGIYVDTGNSTKAEITSGLVSDATFGGNPSKLQQSGGMGTVEVRDGTGSWTLDNTPLWEYLVSDLTIYDGSTAPASCSPSVIDGAGLTAIEKNDLMVACLADYENGGFSAVMIDDAIIDAPRFAVAPQLWHNNLGNGLTARPVREFRPVYIAGVMFKGKGSNLAKFYPDLSDTTTKCYDKGVAQVPASKCDNLTVDLSTAYLLPHGSFSDTVAGFYPGITADSFIPSIWK